MSKTILSYALRDAFLIAGMFLTVIAMGTFIKMQSSPASLETLQYSTLPSLPGKAELTIRPNYHGTAPQEAERTPFEQITLGCFFFILGMGFHSFLTGRSAEEATVKVRKGKGKAVSKEVKGEKKHWVLWMNVKV